MNPSFVIVFKQRSAEASGQDLRRLLDDRIGDTSSASREARSKPLVHVESAFREDVKDADISKGGFLDGQECGRPAAC